MTTLEPKKAFHYHPNDGLPKLAWCLVMDRNDDNINVFHGPFVETKVDFFVEGAWDAAFEDGQFADSTLMMGSGARITGSSLVIATPCHTLEKLYSLQKGSALYVSNSLAFVLTSSSSELHINHIEYHTDLASILLGIKECVKSIPTSNSHYGARVCDPQRFRHSKSA